MKFIGKLLVTGLAAIIAANLLPGVTLYGGFSAVLLVLVLSLLNTFIRPLLILLTIPITILSFGFFLLIINTLIIKWAAWILGPSHFVVSSWWAAFWFSIVLTIVTWLIESLIAKAEKKEE